MIAQVAESRRLSLVLPIVASPFPAGCWVWIAQPDRGSEDDLGRLGEVKPASNNPELASQVRVLLQTDSCIRRFRPEQLILVSPDQVLRIKEWKSKKFLIQPEPHEWALVGEICLRVAKGDSSRLVFLSADGWQETEAQRKKLRVWEAEGWVPTKTMPAQHGLLLEILVCRQGITPCLLSSAGLVADVSSPPFSGIRNTTSLEVELARLQQEEAESVAAGGMSWTTEWKNVTIQDYTVSGRANKKSGVSTRHYYHRLESDTAIFPKKSANKSKTANPYTKNRHLSNNEYARYRSARYRYDAMQWVLRQLESLAKPKRSPDSTGHYSGEYQFLDMRSLVLGEYPHNTFSFVVGQWRWGKRHLKFYHVKSFKWIPVDEPEKIELAREKAQKYLEFLQNQ